MAALWAGAQDERFAGVISNNSGRMGAALTRPVGEDLARMGGIFPHWFTPGFLRRVAAGQPLPVDQHQLLACIAPRALYVTSASEDLHADPEGEFIAWYTAAAAWEGGAGGAAPSFPEPGQGRTIEGLPLGYHLRPGEHAVKPFDWEHWLDFRDRLRSRDRHEQASRTPANQ
ncbi:glucuronyl esterase domain-containing protein [Pseudactinotalea sp. Z1732]|uniref:glucuronyl esterase domain-containing protein n=1 Tax=Micrococcales TaxID=85006 RepID=UPI003C7A4EDC